MAAGLNIKVDIFNINIQTDDAIGGAVISGTMAYQDIMARMTSRRPSQASLEAGLEVNRLFDMVVIGKGLTLRERDEVEISWPLDHPDYAKRYRILGVQRSGQRQEYGPTMLTLTRIERSRSRV